ncbi:hypothetical protein CARM_1177 [Campylobacter armoricus]|uniref:Autotransporter domain-containing protein n=1 Tax=Campylobacter armoricus TaxID=2505970 RepID=A0A7L5HLC0_9BACT|nr:hypothetical protein CARM_1177 [Campylobacter armoricus]
MVQANAKANNNNIVLKDNIIKDAIVSGTYASADNTSANGNSIILEGGNFNNTSIFGANMGTKTDTKEGSAINNTITIKNSTATKAGSTLTQQENNNIFNFKDLYGGYAKDMKQAYLGNTLNLHSLVSTQNFGGFQNINFIINEKVLSELNKGKSFLTITGANPTKLHSNINNNNGGLNEHNNNITIYTNLKDGIESIKEDIVLISNNNGITNSNGDRLTKEHLDSMKSKGELINFRSFVTIQRLNSSEFELAMKDKDQDNIDEELIISIPEEPDIPDKPDNPDTLNPQTKALLEANLAYIPTLIQSDDLVNQTMLDSNANIQLDPNNSFYAATKGSFLRYKSGSHIDIDTLSTLIAYGKNINTYNIFNSIFLETGYTKYKTFNDTVLGNTLGDGKHKYLGMGYFIKKQDLFTQGLYTHAYVKGGIIKNDYEVQTTLKNIDIDTSSAYFGTSLGLGYVKNLKQNILMDLYSRYYYDYIPSKDLNLDANTPLHYNAIHAHRINLGARISYLNYQNFNPFIGIAYENILNANARGSIKDKIVDKEYKIDNPKLQGSTLITELGFKYFFKDLEFNSALKGYFGQREGVSVEANAVWRF